MRGLMRFGSSLPSLLLLDLWTGSTDAFARPLCI